MNEEIIATVDIGSSKISGVAGLSRENGIEVIAADVVYPHEQVVTKGRVVDMEGLTNYLCELLELLEKQAEERIEWLILGIGGAHVKGNEIRQQISIEPQGRLIETSDINSLQKKIRSTALEQHHDGFEILHTIGQQYVVDGHNVTKKKPKDMHGNTLEERAHVLIAATNPVEDMKNCVKKAGAQVESIYPHSWATAEATISQEEKDIGCLVIDFGKGTTDVVLYQKGNIMYTSSIGGGGSNIDNDIAVGIHTSLHYAEDIKKKYGWCNYLSLLKQHSSLLYEKVETLTPSGKLSNLATVESISAIVYNRVNSIFIKLIKERIEKICPVSTIGAGIVLSGGSCRLKGLPQFTADVFKQPARIGIPRKLIGLDKAFMVPEFSSAIGLLMLAARYEKRKKTESFFARVKNQVGRIKNRL